MAATTLFHAEKCCHLVSACLRCAYAAASASCWCIVGLHSYMYTYLSMHEVQRYALMIQRMLSNLHRRSTRHQRPPLPPPPLPCLTTSMSLTGYYWLFTFD